MSTLDADPLDPELELPQVWIDRLADLAGQTTDEALLKGDDPDGSALKYARPALARWAPAVLTDLIRRRFAAAIRSVAPAPQTQSRLAAIWSRIFGRPPDPVPPVVVPPIAKALPRAMLALKDADLAPWRALSDAAANEGAPAPFGLYSVALAGASAVSQIALLSRTMPETGLPHWSARLLEAPGRSELGALAAPLEPTRPAASLVNWLRYIGAGPRGARLDGWQPIARLIRHESAEVRAATFQLIVESDDQVLAEEVAKSGWSFEDGMSRDEAAWGSIALAMAPSAADGSMIARVHPNALGDLLARHPAQQAYLDAFAEHVRLEIERLLTDRTRVYPRALLTVPRGWDELVQAKQQEFLAWMQPFLEGGAVTSDLLFLVEPFPILRALDALDKLVPGAKAGMVAKALRESKSSNMRSGDLYKMATEVSGPGAEEARELALAEANTDKKLFEFAVGLQQNGHSRWLLDRIDQDLAADTAGLMARGLTLAGFLASSEENDAWWAAHHSPPASGWLAEVHAWAAAEYRRFAFVSHWVTEYREGGDDVTALGAHELLVAGADDRLIIGETRPSLEEIEGWPWRRRLHWSVSWEAVKAAMKNREDALEKRFLASEPPLQNQMPRRH